MTFFDKYTYKQKNYALLIIGVLLFAAAYKRAFSVTLQTVKLKDELSFKILQAENAVNGISDTRKQLNQLNKLIGKENITVEKVQQGFLNFFAENASNLEVYQIDEVLIYQHPDFKILTHRIVLKGDFIHSLQFLYSLEKQFDLAKLINVSFEKKKITSEDQEALYTTLLLQNYER